MNISCKQNNGAYKFNNNIVLSDSVQILVNNLVINGGMSYGYKSPDFQEFIDGTTNADLIKLTDYRSPIVRCYAFKGLLERDYPQIKGILFNHQFDIEDIKDSNKGCVRIQQTVRQYMLGELAPHSENKHKLDSIEYAEIEKKFEEK